MVGVVTGLVGTATAQEHDAARVMRWVERGKEAVAAGRIAEGCKLHHRAVTLLPAWWVAQVEYVECARLLGRSADELLAHVDTALAVEPDKPSLWAWRGVLLEDAGRPEHAVAAYETALERAPWLESPRRRLAEIALAAGDLDQAARRYANWTDADPRSALAWLRLADVEWTRGRRERAVEAQERAARLSAYPARAWARLAQMYEAMGQPQERRRALDALSASRRGR